MGNGLLGHIWRGPIGPTRREFSLDQSAASRGYRAATAARARADRKAKRRAQKRARY